MIRVIKNYGIEVTDRCYVVGRITVVQKKNKDGILEKYEIISQPAYFPTFTGCLKWLVERSRADSIRGVDCDLKTAVQVMSEADKRLNKAFAGLGYTIEKLEEEQYEQ